MQAIWHWFLSIGIRWKLQLTFFLVTMITIVINRWVGYGEIEHVIDLARQQNLPPELINQLEQRLVVYIQDSIWHSAIEFVIIFIVIYLLAGIMVKPIQALITALDGIEHGDLTCSVHEVSRDEIGILERRFNAMRLHLNEIMQDIDAGSKQMTNSAYQVSAISHEISEVEQREHARTSEVMQATGELQETMANVHEMAIEVSEDATRTAETARKSMARVFENISTMEGMSQQVDVAAGQMHELNDSAKRIVDVVNSIHGIAEQTNLLALNAAIEAARAGEQGRGFAVVADEVRSLANRTTKSTEEISKIIDELYGNVRKVSDTMAMVVNETTSSMEEAKQIGQVIESMANDVSRTSESNASIAEVSNQQIAKLDVLQQSLERLFSINKENHIKVEATAGIADDLYFVTEKLQKVLSEFTFEKQDIHSTHYPGAEKRKSPRLDYRLRVQISDEGRIIGGSCLDFSMTGIKLRIGEKINPDKLHDVEIYVPHDDYRVYESQKPVVIKARIMWTKQSGKYHVYGMEFVGVESVAKQKLKTCFDYFVKSA